MRRAAVLAAVVGLASCGGNRTAPEPTAFAHPTGEAPVVLDLPAYDADTDQESLTTEVADRLEAAGAVDVQSSPVGGVRMVTATGPDGAFVEVAVGPAPWPDGDANAVVAHHYEHATVPVSVGLVTTDPPFGVRYLMGGEWWGALETEIYRAFANGELARDDAAPFVERARASIGRYTPSGHVDPATLDDLMAAIPRPPMGGTDEYMPIATLVAVGLALGDAVRREHPRLEWVPGEEAMARYFALRDRHDPSHLFRPIDYAVQLYRTPIDGGIAAYAELVDVRLDR